MCSRCKWPIFRGKIPVSLCQNLGKDTSQGFGRRCRRKPNRWPPRSLGSGPKFEASEPRPIPEWSTFTQLVLRLSLTYAHAGERLAARIPPKGRMGLQQKQKMATTQQARWAWLRPP
eukprot:scaffold79849_cov53-Phaeocystis_antarctica.AAC.2